MRRHLMYILSSGLAVAACSPAAAPPSMDDSDMVPDETRETPDNGACIDDLNRRFDSAMDEWQLNVPGPDTTGDLALLTVSGQGNRVILVDLVIAGSEAASGYTEELALDLDVSLSAGTFTLITSGLADDGTTTRVFVEGNPGLSTCENDGRLSPRLTGMVLDYSIQFGDEQVVGSSSDGTLR